MLHVSDIPFFYMSFKTLELPNKVMLNVGFKEIKRVLPYFSDDGVEINFEKPV
jgi:hypothetical protein